jgi:hypothetical protein
MWEGQHRGVEEGPVAFGPLLRAVDEIADDGMSDRAQMQADLVLAARVQFDFEEGGSGETLLDAVVRNGVARRLVIIARKVASSRDVLVCNWQVDGSGCGPRYPFHERQVSPHEGMLPKGRPTCGVALARKSDGNQSRGAAIQSMQSADVRAGAAYACEIGADTREHAVVIRAAVCGHGQQAGGFLNDGKVLVLMRDGKPKANRFGASAIPVIEDRPGSVDSMRGVSDQLRADINLPGFDRVLGLPTRQPELPNHSHVQTLGATIHLLKNSCKQKAPRGAGLLSGLTANPGFRTWRS